MRSASLSDRLVAHYQSGGLLQVNIITLIDAFVENLAGDDDRILVDELFDLLPAFFQSARRNRRAVP